MMKWDAERILALRKALELSRERFAHRIGVTANTIYRWEKGLSLPASLAIIRRLEELEKELKGTQK